MMVCSCEGDIKDMYILTTHNVITYSFYYKINKKLKIYMVSRDRRNPIVLQKVRKQGIKFCHDSPKSKETRNKILAQVNTKDSVKR